jgi:hypothetical protein
MSTCLMPWIWLLSEAAQDNEGRFNKTEKAFIRAINWA